MKVLSQAVFISHGGGPLPLLGVPALASEIHRMLGNRETDARLDETRGFDHRVFVPLHVCDGLAQAPCTELYELTIINKKSSM